MPRIIKRNRDWWTQGTSLVGSIGIPTKQGMAGAVGLQSAVYSIGDSYNATTGSTLGLSLADLVGGAFAAYGKSANAYPGVGSTSIRTNLSNAPMRARKSFVIIEAGRNTVTSNAAQARTDIQGMVNDLAAIGNTRYVVTEIPLTTTEQTAGVGDAGYDAVVAHNAWLVSTFGASRVVAAQDLAYTYPSGDTVHIANTGYHVWGTRLGIAMKALGFLDTSLPGARSTNSIVCGTSTKYLTATPAIAAHDTLPATPNTVESTWSIWVKPTGANTGYVFGRHDGTTSTARMGVRYFGGQWQLYLGNGLTLGATIALNTSAWTHICFVFVNVAGTFKGRLYVNGVQQGADTACGAMSSTPEVRIGESGAGTSFAFGAKYYQPMIWNAALTGTQVTTLYNSGVPLAPSAVPAVANVVACPDLDRVQSYNTTRGVPDRSGTLDWKATGMSSADLSTDIP